MSFIFGKFPALLSHFICRLPGTGDHFTNTAHCLRVGAHDAEYAHIMQDIFCCNGFRTDTGICEGYIFRNVLAEVVTYHQHIQVLINSIYGIWSCRIGRCRQYIWVHGRFDNIRSMAATGTFCMESMDNTTIDRIHGIFQESRFIQSICMDGDLHIILICDLQ
ncbi:hypothetical protein D3C72_766440 [compost metagenome]